LKKEYSIHCEHPFVAVVGEDFMGVYEIKCYLYTTFGRGDKYVWLQEIEETMKLFSRLVHPKIPFGLTPDGLIVTKPAWWLQAQNPADIEAVNQLSKFIYQKVNHLYHECR
jgi:hypothetical protein